MNPQETVSAVPIEPTRRRCGMFMVIRKTGIIEVAVDKLTRRLAERNILYPTSGYFMATLALAGVSWDKWVRFFFPLFCIWIGIAMAFLVYAQATQWVG